MSLPRFIIISAITVFLYFEIVTQIWFVNLLGGQLIKVWILPLILFSYVVIKRLGGSENPLAMNFISVMLVCYAGFGLFSMLLNEKLFFAIKYYLIMIAPLWFFVVIMDNFKDNRDIELMIKVLLICGFLIGIYHYLLQIRYLKDPQSVMKEITTSAGNVLKYSQAWFVAHGIEYSRGLLGYEAGKYCGMLGPGILFSILFFIKSRRRIRYIYLSISCFLGIHILKNLSRSGIVSIFIGIAALMACLYIYEKKDRLKIALYSLFGLMAVAIYLLKYNFNAVLRFLQLLNILRIDLIDNYLYAQGLLAFSSESTIDPHYVSISNSLKAFLEAPLFGNGYQFTEFFLAEHNRYLFILASAGLFVSFPYVLFLIRSTMLQKKALLDFKRKNFKGLNYGYFFFSCSIMFFFKLLNEGMETFYYWIIFALAAAWIRNSHKSSLSPEILQ